MVFFILPGHWIGNTQLSEFGLILEGGPLVILIDCLIFLSPFVNVIRMSMLTVSFPAQIDSGIRLYFPCSGIRH